VNPRHLCVVCVDDSPTNQEALKEYRNFFEIVSVESIGDACTAIIEDRRKDGNRSLVDVFLLDVNMNERAVDHAGLNWGTGRADIVPYGPLLALPFLNVNPLTQFVPYSRFWNESAVKGNGYVLLALSFVLTAIEGREFSLGETHQEIAKRFNKTKFPTEALSAGLSMLRKRLLEAAKNSEIVLHNTIKTIEALNELVASEQRVTLPVNRRDIDESISLDWVFQNGDVERIDIFSLFADVLQFKTSPTAQAILEVVELLEDYAKRSVRTAVHGDDLLYEAAKEVLTRCARYTGEANILESEVAAHPFVVKKSGDPYLLTRIVMLFGWAVAWHERIFLARSETKETWKDLFYTATDKNVTSFNKQFVRYLGEDYGETVSYALHRTPFRACDPARRSFVAESYSLDLDEPGFLRPIDRRLCQRFARDYLHIFRREALGETSHLEPWSGQKLARHRHPRWMTETDIAKMQIGLQKSALVSGKHVRV
jgi:hypothetical protein